MRFIVEGDEYDFEEDSLLLSEAREIKRVTGMTVLEWEDALNRFDADAVAALVWVAKTRAKEDVPPFHALDFKLGSFEVLRPDDGEADTDPTAGDSTPATTG